VFTAAVGDSNRNVYVGSNAGNPYNVLQACVDNTAFGYGAGSNISNVSNSIYMGFYTGAGATDANNVISVGYRAGGNGISNIFIGTSNGRTIATGSNNIFIGHGIDISSVSAQIRIGSATQIPIAADICDSWVGLGGITTPTDLTYSKVEISGSTWIKGGNLGVNIQPGTRTLDVNGNFRARDSSLNVLDFSNGFTRSSGGFASYNGLTVVSNGSNVPIGTLKKGIVIVAVSSGTTDFDGRTEFVLDTTTPIVSNLSSNKSATTTVNFTTDSINISNTTGSDLSYNWAVTYFPLP
jgi:hypothetical protein